MGSPNLLAVISMMIALRLINRTTGGMPKILDSLAITGLGVWLSLRGDWIYGLLIAAGFFLDSRLPIPKEQNLIFSGIMAMATIFIISITNINLPEISISVPELFIVIVVALLFIPPIIDSRKIELFCDLPGETIDPLRLQVCQIFAISAVILVWLLNGRSGFSELLLLWSSIIAVSIVFLVNALLKILIQKTRKA